MTYIQQVRKFFEGNPALENYPNQVLKRRLSHKYLTVLRKNTA